MTTRLQHRLHKEPAPAYWARYTVEVDGHRVGRVERKGGFGAWYAYDADGHFITATMHRADAIGHVVARVGYRPDPTSVVPEGHHRPWEV